MVDLENIDEYEDQIKLVKLINNDYIIGFVESKGNIVNIQYPYEYIQGRDTFKDFLIRPYDKHKIGSTLDEINITKNNIIFITTPNGYILDTYLCKF